VRDVVSCAGVVLVSGEGLQLSLIRAKQCRRVRSDARSGQRCDAQPAGATANVMCVYLTEATMSCSAHRIVQSALMNARNTYLRGTLKYVGT
jgi:hypothetical protein